MVACIDIIIIISHTFKNVCISYTSLQDVMDQNIYEFVIGICINV